MSYIETSDGPFLRLAHQDVIDNQQPLMLIGD
jgi:hypothetical protein